MLVRLRPNRPYLMFLLVAALVVAGGAIAGGVLGGLVAVAAAVLLTLLAYPVLVSTVLRVPVIAVTDQGLRLPLMGPRLPWPEIGSAVRGTDPGARGDGSVLLIFPIDAPAVLRQVRPWLRAEARSNLARFGTPLVVRGASLDHSLAEIASAVQTGLRAD